MMTLTQPLLKKRILSNDGNYYTSPELTDILFNSQTYVWSPQTYQKRRSKRTAVKKSKKKKGKICAYQRRKSLLNQMDG